MTNTKLVAIMGVISIVTALTVGIAGVWLTGDPRVFGLVGLGAAIVGAALVGYFNWRAKLRRRMLGDDEEEQRRAA
jgi:hypothetical protein